jgi:hypothetical protein
VRDFGDAIATKKRAQAASKLSNCTSTSIRSDTYPTSIRSDASPPPPDALGACSTHSEEAAPQDALGTCSTDSEEAAPPPSGIRNDITHMQYLGF